MVVKHCSDEELLERALTPSLPGNQLSATLKLKSSVRYTNCYKKAISFYSSLKKLPSMFSALGTLTPH